MNVRKEENSIANSVSNVYRAILHLKMEGNTCRKQTSMLLVPKCVNVVKTVKYELNVKW